MRATRMRPNPSLANVAGKVLLVLTRLHSLRAWSKSHQGRKLIRYTLVSGSSTIVSFAAIAVFYGLKIIPSVIWATLVGNLVASVRPTNSTSLDLGQARQEWLSKRGRPVLVVDVPRYRLLATRRVVGAPRSARPSLDHLANTGLVVFANLVSFAIFWVLKLMVFNRIFKVDTIDEIDEHLSAEEATPG